MAETLTLTTPITEPSSTTYRFGSVLFQKEPVPEVQLTLIDNNNRRLVITASNTMMAADIMTDLRALNKANLTTKSLEKRLIEWGQARLVPLAGTVSGTPD